MIRAARHFTLVFSILSCARPVPVPEGSSAYALQGGRWFDGERFVPLTMYVVGDTLYQRVPERIDSTVDLSNGWIVPPFGDAHTHSLDGLFQLDQQRAQYRAEGTFYVQVLTNTVLGAAQVRDTFRRRGTIDVAYANAGITATLGHPFLAYEPRAMGIYDQAGFEARRDEVCSSRRSLGNAYWFVNNPVELDTVWPAVLASKPDLIKVFPLYSEHFDPADTASCEKMGFHGLDPTLVPAIVERARTAGLLVWAHVETAQDFAVAVRAGVLGLAHVPGYHIDPDEPVERFEIGEEVVRLAASNGVVVTPTASISADYSAADSVRARRLIARNLARLKEAGVRIVVGSDAYGRPARGEVEALRGLGLWTNLELLRMWAVTTPTAIFPNRLIGRLAEGYEASFLVLDCDPLADWSCTGRIRTRAKDGRMGG
jgi:imidazolonepropionase-like amidohydrolase